MGKNKQAMMRMWNDICIRNAMPPAYCNWTIEDEAKFVELKKKEISMGDTAYGRLVAVRQREYSAAVDTMSKEDRDTLRTKLDGLDEEEAITAVAI